MKTAESSVRTLIGRKFGKSFISNAIIISAGTVLGQGILFCITVLYLRRIYSDVDYGGLSIFTSASAILSLVATMRMELSIPLCDEEQRKEMFMLNIYLITAVSILTFFTFLAFNIYRDKALLLSLGVFLQGIFNLLRAWDLNEKEHVSISLSNFARPLAQGAFQILFGALVLFSAENSLIYGFLASYLIGNVFLLMPLKKISFRVHKIATTLSLFKAHREFALYSFPGAVVAAFGTISVPIVLDLFYNKSITGQYGMLASTVAFPLSLVGASVSQMFYPKLAQITEQAARRLLIEKAVLYLYAVAFICFIPIVFYGQEIVTLFLGNKWSLTGKFAVLMAPYYFFNLISNPISTFSIISKKQKTAALITLAEASSRLLAIYLGFLASSYLVSVGLFSLAGAIICILYTRWILHLCGTSLRAFILEKRIFFLQDLILVPGFFLIYRHLPQLLAYGLGIVIFIYLTVIKLYYLLSKHENINTPRFLL